MSAETMSPIKPPRVSPQEPFHPDHEIGFWRFHHEVKMIRHQAIGMHLPTCLLTGSRERGDKAPAILVLVENRLTSISTAEDVVNRARILHPKSPRHAPALAKPAARRQDCGEMEGEA